MRIDPVTKCNLYDSRRELSNGEEYRKGGHNTKREHLSFSEVLKQTIKKC